MARILAIDVGLKRTGIAVTDPLQIIATALTTIPSIELIPFLKQYFLSEQVELILVGLPRNLDETDTDGTKIALRVIAELRRHFPSLPVKDVDERFTSGMAKNAMIEMGMKKKQRRDKRLVDQIAATIILQEYLQSQH